MKNPLINLYFDLSVLSKFAGGGGSMGGISRYAENLFLGMLRSDDCSAKPCVCVDPARSWRVVDYLEKSHPDLAQQIPSSNFLRNVSRKLTDCREMISSGQSGSLRSEIFKREFYRSLYNFAATARRSLAPNVVTRPGVYHSPWHAVPSRVSSRRGVRHFITVHDLIPVKFPHLVYSQEVEFQKKVLESSKKDSWFICVSESTKNDLLEYYTDVDPDRAAVTPLAALSLFRPCTDSLKKSETREKYGIPKEVPLILSVCTMGARKNIPQVVKCFNRLLREEKVPDVRLVLAGLIPRESGDLYKEIDALKEHKKRVLLIGQVSDEDLPVLFSDADIFINLSLYEGFGLPQLEAMQCGLPVISSNNSSMPEVVGNAGILLDPLDTDAVCQAMLDLLSNEDRRNDLAGRGLERAKQFSWDLCVQDTIQAYRHSSDS